MDYKIVSEKENPLFKRREIIINMDYDGSATPSKSALQSLFATKFSSDPKQVEISKILSENGMSRGKVWIKIWEEKRVPLYSEMKKAIPAEAPAAPTEKKQEKPTEKKESPKEEPKEKK